MGEVTYRAATLDDAELAADVMTAAYPSIVQDPVMTRTRWKQLREGFAVGRYLAERDGRPIAYLGWIHGPWEKLPDRHCEVEVWLDRSALDRDLLSSMWSWIAERTVAEDPYLLLAYAGEDEAEMLAVLADQGYVVERLEKVWELDLRKHGKRIVAEAAAARDAMAAEGVRLLPLSEWGDRDKVGKLYELNNQTVQDVPHTLPILTDTPHDFELRINLPDRPHDRLWIAVQGDRAVAISYLRYPPVRGTVWTGYTCTDREFRGRGVARAVKLQSLAQAVELGVPMVCTDNDSENAPMLHINEKLGYDRRPGFVEHHKRVTK
ncbi:MAG TPA: GNAT family N-acetyltransferase [Candidatus Dormibacteraeota bacterium]|jgi:RimJ/RimL family protein N-acetyltransferase